MTNDETPTETIEIPLELARDCADLFGDLARGHYSQNATTWGDRFHGRARRLNDAVGDDWQAVGIDRFWNRHREGDQ